MITRGNKNKLIFKDNTRKIQSQDWNLLQRDNITSKMIFFDVYEDAA